MSFLALPWLKGCLDSRGLTIWGMEIPDGKLGRNSVLSETISFLRFPLIVLVVFIHTGVGTDYAPSENFPIAKLICKGFISEGIATTAVPLFFLISGFLFFLNADWNLSLYKKKIRSRVSTIVVPFLVWSILTYASLAIWWTIHGPSKPQPPLALMDILERDHSLYHRFPIVFQFWFIRDLFVVCLFTPVWHFLLKRKIIGEIFVLATGIAWFVYRGLEPLGFSPISIFFFCLGAYFSIRGRDFTQDFQKIGIVATVIALPLLVADAMTQGIVANWWFRQSFILVGCVSLVFWASRGVATGKLRSSAFLSGAAFMIYAGHAFYLFSSSFSKLCNAVYIPESEFGAIGLFFFRGIFSVLFWLGVYWCLRRWFPKSLRLLTGGR